MTVKNLEARLTSLELAALDIETKFNRRESLICDILNVNMRTHMEILLATAAVLDKNDDQVKDFLNKSLETLKLMNTKLDQLMSMRIDHLNQLEDRVATLAGEQSE